MYHLIRVVASGITHALDQVGYSLAGQLDNDSILDSFA